MSILSNNIKFTQWTPTIVGTLLNTFTKHRSLNVGRSIHATILRQSPWWGRDIFVQNHLLNLYAKCNKLNYAHQVFDEMSNRNTVTWTMLVAGYDQCGECDKALGLFSQMVADDFQSPPNEFTYASILSSCGKLEQLKQGMQIHSHALQRGFLSNVLIPNVLISFYMACGLVSDAELIFREIPIPDEVSWNSLVSGLSQNNLLQATLTTFQKMRQMEEGVNCFALSTTISACLEDDEMVGKELHAVSVKVGLDSESFTGCALVGMYSICKIMKDAVNVFYKLSFKDVASWNSLVEGYARTDQGERGLHVFNDFLKIGMKPDDFTMIAIFGICSDLVIIEHGKQVHSLCLKNCLDRRVRVGNSMIHMYSKCGSLEDGVEVFKFMEERSVISWTTMMGGLAYHGRATEVINLFEKMKREGLKPNEITYVCVLSACKHGGLVDIGRCVFDSVDMKPETGHLVCMVHMLVGGGRFDEAKEFIHKYSPEHKNLLQQAFLVACKNMGEWERGLEVAKEVMRDGLPADSRTLVDLSSVFATTGMWEKAENLRNEMKKRSMKKEPGCSWIEVDNRIQVFGMNTKQPE